MYQIKLPVQIWCCVRFHIYLEFECEVSCLAANKSRIFGVQKAPLILVSTKQNGRLKGSLKATAINPLSI